MRFLKNRSLVPVAILLLGIPAQASFVLSETTATQLSQGRSPRLDEIKASLLEAEVATRAQEQQYSLEGYVGGNYTENRARALLDFIPVYSPVRSGEFGVRKNTSYGVSGSLGAAVEQVNGQTPNFRLRNATTTVLKLGVSVDLWQDIFGRASRAELERLALANERAKIEKNVNERALVIALRKIYWSLVANKLSTDITQGLLDQSIQQAADVRKRSANYIADAAEVARYEAQVSARRSALNSLNYQRENLIKSLIMLAPEVSGEDIELNVPNVDATVKEVLECSEVIGSSKATPYQFTSYDEMLALLRQEKQNRLTAVDRSGGPTVKLTGEYRTTGVDRGDGGSNGNIGGSIDDFTENNRRGFGVGLNAVIPLDGKKGATEATRELLEQHRFDAQLKTMEANLDATHVQLRNNVTLLVDIIRNQKANSQQLRKRLEIERKKYTQARISAVDLINDQDALLSAELDVVSAQLQILNNLLDYLAVFTETPCTFNRKI